MTDEEAQKKAEKVSELSLSMANVAHTLANMSVAVELLQDVIVNSSILIAEVVKDLPSEVREKLSVVIPKQNESKDSFVSWIRRMLKGGSN